MFASTLRLTLVCCLFAFACAHAPERVPGSSAATPAESAGPFAWDGPGQRLAFADKGLVVRDAVSGQPRRIAATSPSGIAWSPDGQQLVAAWPSQAESQLKVVTLDGTVVRETKVAGTVRGLVWGSDAGIIAAAVEVQSYSFGGHLRTLLHRWPAAGEPSVIVAAETTVMPAVAHQIGTDIVRGQQLALGPLQDEVLYSHLVTPPNVPAYNEIVLRHLGSGAERSVARVGLAPGWSAFSEDGEDAVVCEASAKCQRVDPWTGKTVDVANPQPTRQKPFVQTALSLTPEQRQRLLELHKLRDQGLITPDDYRSAKDKALAR